MIDEYVIVACRRDDRWRSPLEIKRLTKTKCEPVQFTDALRRMAKAGKIEQSKRETTVPRARGSGNLAIELYRKRQ